MVVEHWRMTHLGGGSAKTSQTMFRFSFRKAPTIITLSVTQIGASVELEREYGGGKCGFNTVTGVVNK